MREIKFRMWDEETNKYFTDPKEVMECLKQQAMGMFDHVANGSVFEQYTGLKDKNGVEIYEGDVINAIVLHDAAFPNGAGYYKEIGKVVYSIGYAGYALTSAAYHGKLGISDTNRCEIIGNIHEQEEPND